MRILDLTLDAIGNITAKTSATNPAENVRSYRYSDKVGAFFDHIFD